MKTDYRAYPPRIAVDVEIGERRDGDRPAFTAGSSSVGRYLLLGNVEYRVEMIIENTDDLLRPGMTAFARIDFGRWMIGRILLHKLRQALRPELWMI